MLTAPVHTERPALVRHRQILDFEGLRQEASTAIKEAGLSQAEVARALNVSKGAVSRALKEDGPGWQADLQIRIIEHLTDYQITPEFRVLRKDLA